MPRLSSPHGRLYNIYINIIKGFKIPSGQTRASLDRGGVLYVLSRSIQAEKYYIYTS